jgi:hypothetical protein
VVFAPRFRLASSLSHAYFAALTRKNTSPYIRRGLQIFKQSLHASACVFHFRLRIVLILNSFRNSSVFVADDMLIRYHGYSTGLPPPPPSNCDFCFGCRAGWMSLLLYPFCLKTYLRCCSPPSPLGLSGSQSVPALKVSRRKPQHDKHLLYTGCPKKIVPFSKIFLWAPVVWWAPS